MKVGTLALLREGRHVEMFTCGEHWQWCRRVDPQFGLPQLPSAKGARCTPNSGVTATSLAVLDMCAIVSHRRHRHHPCTIDSSGVGRLCRAFPFLRPPVEAFESAELGRLLLDDHLKGRLHVKGIFIADMGEEHGAARG